MSGAFDERMLGREVCWLGSDGRFHIGRITHWNLEAERYVIRPNGVTSIAGGIHLVDPARVSPLLPVSG